MPLPGETILVAAALLAASAAQINIVVVVLAAATGAIVGDGMGYMVGRWLGLPFLRRCGRYIRFDEDRLLIGRYLFFSMGAPQYGSAVVFFGRFIAVLRMFAALLAGANSMPAAGRFFFFNITGGVCWACLFGFGAHQVSTGTQYCGAGSRLACDIGQRVRRVGYDKQYGLGRSVHDLRHDVAVNFGVLCE